MEKVKVDLDLFPRATLLGNILPELFQRFKTEVNRSSRENRYDEDKKRNLIGIYETSQRNIITCANPNRNIDYDCEVLDHLLDAAIATDIYVTFKKLVKMHKEYMEIDIINIECITSYPTRINSIQYELKKIIEANIFDSIQVIDYIPYKSGEIR